MWLNGEKKNGQRLYIYVKQTEKLVNNRQNYWFAASDLVKIYNEVNLNPNYL